MIRANLPSVHASLTTEDIQSEAHPKVLHVITCLDVGGAEIALKKLVLSDVSPSQHFIVSLRDIGPIGLELQAAGVRVQALNMGGFGANLIAIPRLVRLIRSLNPSVIQTWMYHADLVGGLAAKAARRKELVWGVHHTGFAPDSSGLTLAVMKACAHLSYSLPRVIVCCAAAARETHAQWGYNARIMRVIPNGFDCPPLDAARAWRCAVREQAGIPQECLTVGMVARFHPLKDHHGFIEAAKIVAEKNANVRFMLVGRGIDVGNEVLMKWIRDANLADRFSLLGERRDVDRCLAAMDVFCLSSIHEAFPNVIGEAMVMGVPCVVTDVGDARSIVGQTGWIVRTRSPNELSRALLEALALPAQERQMRGAAARKRVLDEFSMAKTRELFEQAYVDAISDES